MAEEFAETPVLKNAALVLHVVDIQNGGRRFENTAAQVRAQGYRSFLTLAVRRIPLL
jgi:hypothetical protein